MSIGMDGMVYVPGFVNETTPVVFMRFDYATGDPMPSSDGLDGAVYIQDAALVRPIGILADYGSPMSPPTDTDAPETTDGPELSSGYLPAGKFVRNVLTTALLGSVALILL